MAPAASLELRISRRAWEWNRVPHVGKPGHVSNGPLETEAETGMRNRAIAAQIAIPTVRLAIQAMLAHSRVEHFEPLFPLTAAYDFADTGRQYVHGRDSLLVVVQAPALALGTSDNFFHRLLEIQL